jgi:hypothetical protein
MFGSHSVTLHPFGSVGRSLDPGRFSHKGNLRQTEPTKTKGEPQLVDSRYTPEGKPQGTL